MSWRATAGATASGCARKAPSTWLSGASLIKRYSATITRARPSSIMNEEALKEFSSLEIEPLIADRPAEPRDSSRLLAVSRADGSLSHRNFRDLPELLGPGDMLVLNRSKVWKARLAAAKPTGGKSEIL